MKVLLLQLDGKIPNLALMRIAAYHRELGDQTELRVTGNFAAIEPHFEDRFEKVYASTIFLKTRPVAERLRAIHPNVIIGGTGWDLLTTVETYGITTQALDYSQYPRFRQSIGFTQRGCRLKCEFCVVPR